MKTKSADGVHVVVKDAYISKDPKSGAILVRPFFIKSKPVRKNRCRISHLTLVDQNAKIWFGSNWTKGRPSKNLICSYADCHYLPHRQR